jgi:hypothetical protein
LEGTSQMTHFSPRYHYPSQLSLNNDGHIGRLAT